MRWRRRRNKKAVRRRLAVMAVSFLMLGGMVALDSHVMPLLQQYSRTQAQWQATRTINAAVTAVLSAQQPSYQNLVQVSRDEEGNVTAVEADIQALNLLKAAVSSAVTEKIGAQREMAVAIPLGTFVGSHYFSGRGPRITLPISMSGSVLTNIVSVLEAQGVNQTMHRIEMEIKTTLFLAVPTAPTSVEVTTSFIIAESVLLGKVPEGYTVVMGDSQDTIGRIFDYGVQLEN